ncbi:MAG: DUF2029 domain-containing protein [Anaerolineales bacterium]|nr:DUF2029 domain-containing protein [Anaerolineales bacterium]
MVVGIGFVVSLAVVLNLVPLIRHKSDFFLRWYASKQLLEIDRPLYSTLNSEETELITYGEGGSSGYLGVTYYYPAFMLILTAPLSYLPYPAAHLVWTIAGQLMLFVALWLLMNERGWPGTVNGRSLFLGLVTVSVPFLQHTIWGQFNTIGVLALAGAYLALRKGHLVTAGVLATGLLFKPQAYLFPLLFLLFWALWRRSRWPFLTGFGVASAALWGIGALLEPGWVRSFLTALAGYEPAGSVVDLFFNPYQITAVILTLYALAVMVGARETEPGDPAWIAALATAAALWALIVPILGLFHLLIFPAVLVLLLPQWRARKWVAWSLLGVWAAGWAAFLAGLAIGDGSHIRWTGLAYEAVLPVAILALSWPAYRHAWRKQRVLL